MRWQSVLAAAGATAAALAGTAAPSLASPALNLAASSPLSIWAWGEDSEGQLGNFTSFQSTSPDQVGGVLAGADVTQVAAGGENSAVLLSNGTVWAWGNNTFGLLGTGSTGGDSDTPGQVPGLSGITQIAIESNGSDSFAVGKGGVVWSWGVNTDGQLGDGTTSPSAIPMQLSGLTGITQVAAGPQYTLALRSDGTVWAWGANGGGQLGDGTTTERHTPVQVSGLTGITQVANGSASYALRNDGTVFAWGNGSQGLLGLASGASVPTPVKVPGLSGITRLADGGDHAFALTSSGTVLAWGSNSSGQLGDGTTTSHSTPEALSLSGITKIAATFSHNAAIRSDGTLLTWGDDSQGQLGNGTCCTTVNPNPVPVPSLASVSQVAIGLDFMLALGSPPPPPVVVAVPDLSGESQATATHNLQAAGLVLGSVGTVTDNSCNNIGLVLSQSPAAGTRVNQGSAVSITVGKRPTHPCP